VLPGQAADQDRDAIALIGRERQLRRSLEMFDRPTLNAGFALESRAFSREPARDLGLDLRP